MVVVSGPQCCDYLRSTGRTKKVNSKRKRLLAIKYKVVEKKKRSGECETISKQKCPYLAVHYYNQSLAAMQVKKEEQKKKTGAQNRKVEACPGVGMNLNSFFSIFTSMWRNLGVEVS